MLKRNPRKEDKRGCVRGGKPRALASVALVVSLLVAAVAVVNWGGSRATTQGTKEKKSGAMSIESFAAGSPSKEYVYAGGRLIATEESSGGASWRVTSMATDWLTSHSIGRRTLGNLPVRLELHNSLVALLGWNGVSLRWSRTLMATERPTRHTSFPRQEGKARLTQSSNQQQTLTINQPLFVSAGWPVLGDTPIAADFDGDGKADPGIWRSSDGVWIIPKSSSNYASYIFAQWGASGDVPIAADFDGDHKADIGFYRNGLWGVLKSSQSYDLSSAQFFSWGASGLAPTVAEFDGDGKADLAYIVPSGGTAQVYAILKSTTSYDFNQAIFVAAGNVGDTAVVTDYDGDVKADPGTWRSSTCVWSIPKSTANYLSYLFSQWGQAGDIAMPNKTNQY